MHVPERGVIIITNGKITTREVCNEKKAEGEKDCQREE